ncbi:MAG TPA: DUF2721 domain-containing protein [Streptosporangiaceae bacterium]|nr:DUF2721 domain-containing protein [Streptosporangiaceae bacterium]
MTLSPVSAIEAMVTPVVFLSVGGLFANGLLTAANSMGSNLRELNRERQSILAGPHGEVLTEDQVPAIERARLSIISHEQPLLLRRIRGIRNACVTVYLAMSLLVASVIFIAAAIPDQSDPLAFTALGLVVAAVLSLLAAVVQVTAVAVKAANAVSYDTRRTEELH